jgi:alpha-galactosidase
VHTGRVVRRSLEGDDLWLHGAVSPDRTEALYGLTLRERHVTWPAGRVRLPGLDPDATYRVRPSGPAVVRGDDPRTAPAWWADGLRLSGAALGSVGISVPALDPDQAVLIHVEVER